jgi:hypothetical protein
VPRGVKKKAHEKLKEEGDFYQKIIIFTSLASGIFESIKMKMNLTDPALELLPIILSSFVAGISSFIKFKQYNERQETLIQSTTILSNTLNQVRNADELTEEITHSYHHSLELLETSLYPDVRRKFLKVSQRNMESIIKNENCYFENIERVKQGKKIKKCESDNTINADNSTDNVLISTPPQTTKKELDVIDEYGEL